MTTTPPPQPPQTVVLTGASGYLGQHIMLELLASEQRVTAFVRDPSRLGALADHPGVHVHQGDLTDEDSVCDAVQGAHAVLHAALIWDSVDEELELRDTIAAAKLFNAAGRAGVRRCVMVSSTAVHRPFRPAMSEADPLQPTDHYGACKAAAELMMWSACHRHGMTGVVARSGPVVGPPAVQGGPFRSDRTLRGLVRAAQAGEPLEVTAGDGRQLIGTKALARTLQTLVSHPDAHGTYLCAHDALTLWTDIAEQVVQVTRSSSRVEVSTARSSATPRFDVGRLTALLGGPVDSQDALTAHIRYLSRDL